MEVTDLLQTQDFKGRLVCERHGLLTCLMCLHSINAKDGGKIPEPGSDDFPCSDSAHSVEPRFEMFNPNLDFLGYRSGLSPDERKRDLAKATPPMPNGKKGGSFPITRCRDCDLTYVCGGAPVNFASHPSHICPDGQRYIVVRVEPFKFSRQFEKVVCDATFEFGPGSKLNVDFSCFSQSDEGTAEWNLDNAEIAAHTQLLQYVEDAVIPHRQDLVRNVVYTNSAYFAGRAWRFQLLISTSINPSVLELLLKADKLEYSVKRKAFIERNKFGIVTVKYPITEERRYQVSRCLHMVKRLASVYGIQVFWRSSSYTDKSKGARSSFMNQPYRPPSVQNGAHQENRDGTRVELSEAQEIAKEELLQGDSFDNLRIREGFDAVKLRK